MVPVTQIYAHDGPAYALAIAADGTSFFSGGRDGFVHEWPSSGGKPRRSLKVKNYPTAIALGPQSRTAAIAAIDEGLIWPGDAQKPSARLKHKDVETAAIDALETRVATAGDGGRVRLWSVPAGRLLAETTIDAGRLVDLHWLSDTDEILASGQAGTVFVLSGEDLALRRTMGLAAAESVYRARRSPDGALFAAALSKWGLSDIASSSPFSAAVAVPRRYEIAVWDAQAAGSSAGLNLVGHLGWIGALEFSPDSKILASGAIEGIVKIWDPYQRRLLAEADASARLHDLAFTPDGRLLMAATGRGLLLQWNLETFAGSSSSAGRPPAGDDLNAIHALVEELLAIPEGWELERRLEEILGLGDATGQTLSTDALARLNAALNVRQERAYREGDAVAGQRCQFILQFGGQRIRFGATGFGMLAALTGPVAHGAASSPSAADARATEEAAELEALGAGVSGKRVESIAALFNSAAHGHISVDGACDLIVEQQESAGEILLALDGLGWFGPQGLPDDPGPAVIAARVGYAAACRIGEPALVVQVGIVLVSVLGQTGATREALPLAQNLLDGTHGPMARAELLSMLGNLYQNAGDPRRGAQALQQATDELSELDGNANRTAVQAMRARVYVNLAVIHHGLGDHLDERLALGKAEIACLQVSDTDVGREVRLGVRHGLARHYLAINDLESAEAAYASIVASASLSDCMRPGPSCCEATARRSRAGSRPQSKISRPPWKAHVVRSPNTRASEISAKPGMSRPWASLRAWCHS